MRHDVPLHSVRPGEGGSDEFSADVGLREEFLIHRPGTGIGGLRSIPATLRQISERGGSKIARNAARVGGGGGRLAASGGRAIVRRRFTRAAKKAGSEPS